MSLYTNLQSAKSEEDVKDAYIKALGLVGYSKNLIDIQTKEVWFESKDTSSHSTYAMFTQLLHYVYHALTKGEYIPPFLCVIDTKKAAILKTADVLPFLNKKSIKWGRSASNYTKEALDSISAFIGTYLVSFKIETHEKEFIETLKHAIRHGEIIRTQITPDNLRYVFDKWVEMIGREIRSVSESDYALLFFADIMHDGSVSTHDNLTAQLLHRNNSPVFSLNGKLYELNSREGYRRFWAIYHKPPKAEYRNYLLERRDSLIPIQERVFKGAFYTPLHIVDKAYDKLSELLGPKWQSEYVVWDMCCGVGNLEVLHSKPRNVFMSTLDNADIDVMKSTKTCLGATHFQYDYLNDDIDENGAINYCLSNKLPDGLINAINSNKKILVLINPPYAEATNSANTSIGVGAKNKKGVAKTLVASRMMSDYGKATNELFTQFIARIAKEMPNATLAMFSKIKYINAPNFEDFRKHWNAKYLGGFIVHSKAFDGLKGHFPIGFLVWKTSNNSTTRQPFPDIECEVLNKQGIPIGEKVIHIVPSSNFLAKWFKRSKSNDLPALPLVSAITPTTGNPRVKTWSDGAIGYMCAGTSDVQNSIKYTYLLSSPASRGNGFYVNKDNFVKASIIFSVQQSFKPTWVNDRDNFLIPSSPINSEFETDCIVFLLFNNSNYSAGAKEIVWNGQIWNIVNHFIPFTESELGASERFESDFMANFLAKREFSNEANAVLRSAKSIWIEYYKYTDSYKVRDELKLNRSDVGWYQVRTAISKRNESGDFQPVSFSDFKRSYKILETKIESQIYKLGFLK